MLDYYQILVFAMMSALCYFSRKNSIKGMIARIGINKKYYPDGYITPPKKIAKFLKISWRPIPKFLYYSVYLLPVYLVLFPVNVAVYLLSHCEIQVARNLITINMLLVGIDTVIFVIGSIMHKNGKSIWL